MVNGPYVQKLQYYHLPIDLQGKTPKFLDILPTDCILILNNLKIPYISAVNLRVME